MLCTSTVISILFECLIFALYLFTSHTYKREKEVTEEKVSLVLKEIVNFVKCVSVCIKVIPAT